MSDQWERYKQTAAELAAMEANLVKLKDERSALAKALFEQHGKGHVYDLGDGVPMIIVTSKNGTHFFTPKDKWRGKPRKEKAPKPAKVATKKVIVNERVVEVPVRRVVEVSATLKPAAAMTQKAPVVPIPASAAVKSDPPEDDDPLAAALAALK